MALQHKRSASELTSWTKNLSKLWPRGAGMMYRGTTCIFSVLVLRVSHYQGRYRVSHLTTCDLKWEPRFTEWATLYREEQSVSQKPASFLVLDLLILEMDTAFLNTKRTRSNSRGSVNRIMRGVRTANSTISNDYRIHHT